MTARLADLWVPAVWGVVVFVIVFLAVGGVFVALRDDWRGWRGRRSGKDAKPAGWATVDGDTAALPQASLPTPSVEPVVDRFDEPTEVWPTIPDETPPPAEPVVGRAKPANWWDELAAIRDVLDGDKPPLVATGERTRKIRPMGDRGMPL